MERLQHFTQHQPKRQATLPSTNPNGLVSSLLSLRFPPDNPQAALAVPYRSRLSIIPRSVGSGPRVCLITYQYQINLLDVQNVELPAIEHVELQVFPSQRPHWVVAGSRRCCLQAPLGRLGVVKTLDSHFLLPRPSPRNSPLHRQRCGEAKSNRLVSTSPSRSGLRQTHMAQRHRRGCPVHFVIANTSDFDLGDSPTTSLHDRDSAQRIPTIRLHCAQRKRDRRQFFLGSWGLCFQHQGRSLLSVLRAEPSMIDISGPRLAPRTPTAIQPSICPRTSHLGKREPIRG